MGTFGGNNIQRQGSVIRWRIKCYRKERSGYVLKVMKLAICANSMRKFAPIITSYMCDFMIIQVTSGPITSYVRDLAEKRILLEFKAM